MPEKVLSELAKHLEETEEGGGNVNDKMNEQFLLSCPIAVAMIFFFHFVSSFSAASRRLHIRTTQLWYAVAPANTTEATAHTPRDQRQGVMVGGTES